MKYEYKIVKMNSLHDTVLYDMGQDGWELICFNTYITDNFGYFKRELKDTPTTARICYEDGTTIEK